MKREPRTFLEYLIQRRAVTRRNMIAARQDERRKISPGYGSADDETIYAVYETQAEYDEVCGILANYRYYRAKGKT